MIQIPDSDKICKFTLEISVFDGVTIEPDKTLDCTDSSSIILSPVTIEIKLSEILFVFSMIVFTLEIAYPPESNISDETCFPGMETVLLSPSSIFSES